MVDHDSNVVISAFKEDQVAGMTGISIPQLRYRERTNFFQPSLAYENRQASYGRIYSLLDIVGLKVVNALHAWHTAFRLPNAC